MKLNKKTIIILIVAAVAGYLVWKRYKDSTAAGSADSVSSGGASLDPSSLEDVITAAEINNSLAAKVREKYAETQSNSTLRNTIQTKANEKGNTFAQQVLFEALYAVYHVKTVEGTWTLKDESASATWKAIVARVKAM